MVYMRKIQLRKQDLDSSAPMIFHHGVCVKMEIYPWKEIHYFINKKDITLKCDKQKTEGHIVFQIL